MGRSLKFIKKTSNFEGLAGRIRERRKVSNNIKNDANIHPQINENSMLNLCSKKGCKNDGEWMENGHQARPPIR